MHDPELDPLDAVRRHLDRQAERVDPRPLLARIRAEIAPRPVPRRRWLTPVLATAATLAAVLLGGWWLVPVAASPRERELVRATQQVHRLPVDRCYLVEVRRDPAFLEVFPNTPLMQTNRLWTRGDRFFFLPPEGRPGRAWGRDENGNLWLAPTPRVGVRVESEEIPAPLSAGFEVHTLRVDQLLGEVLRNFDLKRAEHQTDDLSATEVIRATPIFGRFSAMIRSATLEIDPETKVLRRLVIARGPIGKPVATTTYTLIETTTLDPVQYSLEGHLREPFEIVTRDNQPQRRLELLRRMYGPVADKWFGAK